MSEVNAATVAADAAKLATESAALAASVAPPPVPVNAVAKAQAPKPVALIPNVPMRFQRT